MKNNLLRSVRVKNLGGDFFSVNSFGTFSLKFTTTSVPVNYCNCFQVYKPVRCSNRKTYSNRCFAGCSGQTNCTNI